MNRRIAIAAAALALLAPIASAQTLDEVLAKHYEAMGGYDKMKAVQTYRMAGKMMMGQGMEAPFTMEKARPNKFRMEFTFQGMTGVQAYDGKSGWMIMPFSGKKDPEPMPSEAAREMEEQADFDGPLVDWKEKGHTVELVGQEDVEGTSAHKIKATLKNGNVLTYYIDAETFLTLKQDSKRTIRGTEVEGESSVGDYKQVDGLTFPFAMEMGAKGSPQKQKLVTDKIEINPKLEDARFVMPAVAKTDSAVAARPAGDKGAAKDTKTAEAKKSGDKK